MNQEPVEQRKRYAVQVLNTLNKESSPFMAGRKSTEDMPFFKLGGVGYEVSALRRLMDEEARVFALHLLMPNKLVKRAALEKGITSIDHLANLFEVSQGAMMEKLRILGLIEA